jgi:hypothetical protein
MAHFAELDENNIVLRVCVVDNNIQTSDGPLGENDMHIDGETWCTNFWTVADNIELEDGTITTGDSSGDIIQQDGGAILTEDSRPGGTWKQTSYNHSFRLNYTGPGDWYDAYNDQFVEP